jgi:hypothetical protein
VGSCNLGGAMHTRIESSVLALILAAGCGSTALETVDAQPGTDDDDAASSTPDAPGARQQYAGKYASPTIVRDGATFHTYFAADRFGGTHYNAPHATFDAQGEWTFVGDALPQLGTNAFAGPGNYPVWAPSAAQIDATHWMLYYTAQLEGTEAKKCIWRAHADNPNGPFVDDYAGPITCLEGSLRAIDPYLVKDAQGTWHLAARLDEAGGINTIKIRELGPGGAQFATGSSWIELTHNAPTSWEQPVLENAGVVRLAPPTKAAHWFVFYSGGAWDADSYGIGYADCGTGINGPCTKKTPNGPWLGTDAAIDLYGPGTPTFYTDGGGHMMMSIQAWAHTGGTSNPQNHGQIMRTYEITVDDNYTPTATLVRTDR